MTKVPFKSALAAAALTAHGCIGLALCFLFTESASADEFRAQPDSVQFDFEQKGDAQNRTCNLMTMITDPSRPEVVNFRIIHALSPTTLFFGYSLDVGDMRYQNGLPAGLDHVALARGEVSTKDFSSEGSMYGGRPRTVEFSNQHSTSSPSETCGKESSRVTFLCICSARHRAHSREPM